MPTPQDSGREALSYVEGDSFDADEHIMFGLVQERARGETAKSLAIQAFCGPPRVVPRTLAALGSDMYDADSSIAQAVFLAGVDSAVTARLPVTLEMCRSLLARSSAERQVLQLSQIMGIASAVLDDSATSNGSKRAAMTDGGEDESASTDTLGAVSHDCVQALREFIPTGEFAARLVGIARAPTVDGRLLSEDPTVGSSMFGPPS